MFTAVKGSRRHGFSLVELLAALAVTAIVAPAILAVLPRAFASLSEAVSEVRSTRAIVELDSSVGRDFASLVAECGFSGDKERCSFWTMRPSPGGGFSPALVEYRREALEIVRSEFPLPLYVSLSGTNAPSSTLPDTSGEPPSRQPEERRFAVVASPFRYGGVMTAAKPGMPEWSSPTNAPASLEFALGAPGGMSARRLFFRRTSQ
jgi:prepilin-type N-terminal cleavage/methylation domain-containing protein